MMSWMNGWLSQIIFIILLAAFIDLLLPNRSMQRYVKLVISLLILVTILSPILSLFQDRFAERLADGYERMSAAKPSAERRFENLDHIVREGDRLKRKQEQRVKQMVESQISEQMKQQIEQKTGVPVNKITVQIAEHTQDGKTVKAGQNVAADEVRPVISSVEIYLLLNSKPSGKSENQEPIAAIKPMDKVKVDIGMDSTSPLPEDALPVDTTPLEVSSTADKQFEEQRVMKEKVLSQIRQMWGVEEKQVKIYMEENGVKVR